MVKQNDSRWKTDKYTLINNRSESACKRCWRLYFSGKFWIQFLLLAMNCIFFLIQAVFLHVLLTPVVVADLHVSFVNFWIIFISIFFYWMSQCSSKRNTYNLVRAELIGALVNSVCLIGLCVSMFCRSVNNIIRQPYIRDCDMLFVQGGVHLFTDVISLVLLRRYTSDQASRHVDDADESFTDDNMISMVVVSDKESLLDEDREDSESHYHAPPGDAVQSRRDWNLSALYLQMVRSTITSCSSIICGAAIKYTDGDWRYSVDAVINIVASTFLALSAYYFLLDIAAILTQSVPKGLNTSHLQKKLLSTVSGVLAVHEFHVWQLTDKKVIASAHIRCHNPDEYMTIAEQVKTFFHNEGIHSVTIQPEFAEPVLETFRNQEICVDDLHLCLLDCESTSCAENKCCPQPHNFTFVNPPILASAHTVHAAVPQAAKGRDQGQGDASGSLGAYNHAFDALPVTPVNLNSLLSSVI